MLLLVAEYDEIITTAKSFITLIIINSHFPILPTNNIDWRGDNAGPPMSPEELQNDFKDIAREFPGAKVIASTFDEWANLYLNVSTESLPFLDKEIGDR